MADAPRNLIWIASYPKSGNTWVRFLACNLVYGRQDSSSALNVLAPDVHESQQLLQERATRSLAKTHFAFSAHMPLAQRTAAAIYIVRHPLRVLVSNYHYARRSGRSDLGLEEYAEAFIRQRGDPRWQQLGFGSWEQNVLSWLAQRHEFPVLGIRYEDLTADPVRVCGQIARLLGLDVTQERLREAVDNSTFERLRAIEEADIRERRPGIFYKPYLKPSIDAGLRFMRSGAVADGTQLPSDQLHRFETALRPLLAQLGYINSAPTPLLAPTPGRC